jgi:hypothetical protein
MSGSIWQSKGVYLMMTGKKMKTQRGRSQGKKLSKDTPLVMLFLQPGYTFHRSTSSQQIIHILNPLIG